MDVPIDMCKPDPAGKSTGSFNGETGCETTRSQSPPFHAAWNSLTSDPSYCIASTFPFVWNA